MGAPPQLAAKYTVTGEHRCNTSFRYRVARAEAIDWKRPGMAGMARVSRQCRGLTEFGSDRTLNGRGIEQWRQRQGARTSKSATAATT
jgi:hypothetical protein